MIGDNSLQTLMLVAGIGLLCWLMLRGRLKARRRREFEPSIASLKHNANTHLEPTRFSGMSSVGAPVEVLRWQVELHELARQLKAELDSKIVAVRTLSQEYDRAAGRLRQLISEAQALGEAQPNSAALARRLADAGCSVEQIATAVGLSPHAARQLVDAADPSDHQS